MNGYRWWYLDASSEDGEHSLVVIAMLGNVFSPYYKRARDAAHQPVVSMASAVSAPSGGANPLDYSTFHVALYPKGTRVWSLRERPRHEVTQSFERLAVGGSVLERVGPGQLEWRLDERAGFNGVRWRGQVRGRIKVTGVESRHDWQSLDGTGAHHWAPWLARAQVQVDLDEPNLGQPAMRWRGTGYVDSNAGCAPLESTLAGWCWSRAHLADGRTLVTYDAEARAHAGAGISTALMLDAQGELMPGEPAQWRRGKGGGPSWTLAPLPTTRWGIAQRIRADVGTRPKVMRQLEDTPFYTRAWVETTWLGERVRAMHEVVSMSRFEQRWVQFLIPFRMTRSRPAVG